MVSYEEFLENKSQYGENNGFNPVFMPDFLFNFQKALIEWSLKKGRSAIFADCGLGKTPMQLVWAENIVRKTNKPVLIITPLSVSIQTELEAQKFQIDAFRSKQGIIKNKIIITNYERLHYFNPDAFSGVVCDESSILKNFNGAIKSAVNIFLKKVPYRLLATATAAPNDYIELGTSSEALGYLGYIDMLNRFFKNDSNTVDIKGHGRFKDVVKWRLKKHAHLPFWRWITSWARAIRKPSDLGFDDKNFILPELKINKHAINIAGFSPEGFFPQFSVTAIGLKEERQELKATIKKRCEYASQIINSKNEYFSMWCNLNEEGDLLTKLIPDSVQVSGKDSDDAKEEKLISYSTGKIRCIIIKPKIGAFGLNWQHCNNVVCFPTHSYEQFYQLVRRHYRFGQKNQVNVEMIYTYGFENAVYNLERKQNQAEVMFAQLVKEMNNSLGVNKNINYNKKEELPTWLF